MNCTTCRTDHLGILHCTNPDCSRAIADHANRRRNKLRQDPSYLDALPAHQFLEWALATVASLTDIERHIAIELGMGCHQPQCRLCLPT